MRELQVQDMILDYRQQKLNEEGGTLCGCGAWSDDAGVDGGCQWATMDLGLVVVC